VHHVRAFRDLANKWHEQFEFNGFMPVIPFLMLIFWLYLDLMIVWLSVGIIFDS
jgi:hypothetical protein